MHRSLLCTFLFMATLVCTKPLGAHGVHYNVVSKGTSVMVFYSATDPAGDAGYEIFGPGDMAPFATGRTDKNGVVSFLPDRAGVWTIKVLGESRHGHHGVTVIVTVSDALNLVSFRKPLLAEHQKLLTGASSIFGVFGLVSLAMAARKNRRE